MKNPQDPIRQFCPRIVAFANSLAEAAKRQKRLHETVQLMIARHIEVPVRDLVYTWPDVAFSAKYDFALTPEGIFADAVLPNKLGWWLDRLREEGYDVPRGRNDAYRLTCARFIGFDGA